MESTTDNMEPTTEKGTPRNADRLTILIVDDEKWALVYLKSLFHKPDQGFEVVATCRESNEAIGEVEKKKPDILITDIRMPHINGLELIEHIRNLDIPCQIVVVSAFSEFAYAQKAIGLGVCEYLVKPVAEKDANEVLSKIRIRLKEKIIPLPDEAEPACNDSEMQNNFGRLCSFIEKNYNQRLYLKDLAREFGIAPNYCCTLFAREKGMTFSQYVTRLRMEKAASLLRFKELTINMIASMVGFDDYSYFDKNFKRYFGLTPTEFRGREN